MATVGVFACVFDREHRILLVRQAYGARQWTTPGGRVETRESPVLALRREVHEETSCEIEIVSLIGVYSKPYKDDFVLSFLASVVAGVPRANIVEISEIQFFSRAELPNEMAPNTLARIIDGFENRRSVCRIFEDAQSAGSLCVPCAP